jgi:hypothetical protein
MSIRESRMDSSVAGPINMRIDELVKDMFIVEALVKPSYYVRKATSALVEM